MKILIADDDPVSSRLMQRTLERRGYEAVMVADGHAAALELNSPGGPKLALLDWMMPGIDGLEVCRTVRRSLNDSYVYILLLTSKQTMDDMVAGLEAGADDYLTKPFNPAELHARLLTGQRVLSLEKKLVHAREDMRFRATHDSLTGLLNRASILALLHQKLERIQADKIPFGLLLCDVDYFKKVNDFHGHGTGDAVLREVAKRFREVVEPFGSVGRYGGEEFLVLLQNCSPEDLLERSEQIRSCLPTRDVQTSAGAISVSVSIGGTLVTHQQLDLRSNDIIKRADEALYLAKAEGRNCVRVAPLPSAAKSTPAAPAARNAPSPLRREGAPNASLADHLLCTTLQRSSPPELRDEVGLVCR